MTSQNLGSKGCKIACPEPGPSARACMGEGRSFSAYKPPFASVLGMAMTSPESKPIPLAGIPPQGSPHRDVYSQSLCGENSKSSVIVAVDFNSVLF